MKDGRLTKPMVAWCTGTCAKVFPYEVQFGHAGALANATQETAAAKNAALKAAGAFVPDNFEVRDRLMWCALTINVRSDVFPVAVRWSGLNFQLWSCFRVQKSNCLVGITCECSPLLKTFCPVGRMQRGALHRLTAMLYDDYFRITTRVPRFGYFVSYLRS